MKPATCLLSLALVTHSSLVLATTPGDCPSGLACCSSGSKLRRSIFPRTDCPVNVKKCCEQTKMVVSVSPGSNTLQCGKSTEATGPLTIEINPCPSDTTKDCLHFNYGANTDGINYVDVHLGLYRSALTAFVPPGQLNANSYCSLTNGGVTADCYIPLADVSSKYLGGADPCDKSLVVVAHISYPDSGPTNGNTCYGRGSDVPGANWAMEFDIKFSCSEQCVKDCCCPAPQQPDIWCPIGTGYGYVSPSVSPTENSLSPLPNTCKHWGWYIKTSTFPVSGTIYIGAGNNDISKATNAGTFSITRSGSTVTVTYSFGSNYKATETHIYGACSQPTDCSPGKLGRTANANGVSTFDLTCSGSYYFILHAAVSGKYPAGTDCSAITIVP